MMNWYEDYLLANQRRQEDIRRAEEHRMIRQLQDGEAQPTVRWYDRLLSRMGDAMVSWGERLQARACRPIEIQQASLYPKA